MTKPPSDPPHMMTNIRKKFETFRKPLILGVADSESVTEIIVVFILIDIFAGEEPTNEQSYRYLTNDGDFKLQDDSHDMDTTEKKNSTMSRAGNENAYGADTIERTLIR